MRVFAKVVEQGGFARAAVAMDMSNAVVTRHIADLEDHLGTRLLNRTTRRLSLTETGHAYLERVKQILQDVDDADAVASAHAQTPSGTLRIYCHPGFGQEHLARLLPKYAALQPKVALDVTLSAHSVDLVEDSYDIGIFIDFQKFDTTMIARQLATSEVMVCASPEYIAKHGAPATPEEISEHICLNFSYEQLRHHWTMRGPNETAIQIPINSRVISNNGHLLRECAIAGMGIVLRTSFILGDDLSSGKLVRLLPALCLGKVTVMMVYPSRRGLSAKVRSFVEFMNAQFPHPEADPWCPTGDCG
jgi:DNA-binding transcriptional LysR family regulator